MIKILIVDDIEQNLYMLQVLLQGHRYEVISAMDGRQALDLARNNPPDIIVTDILMPVMDGFTLCREWRKDSRLKEIPFVFYTATYTDQKDKEFALSLGADHFLVKPMDPELLMQTIQDILAEHMNEKDGDGQTAVNEQPADNPADDTAYFQQYNQALIRKLEDKMMQLKQANGRLTTLYKTSDKLASIKLQDKSVAHILRIVIDTLGYPKAEYFGYDDATQTLSLIETVGQLTEKTPLHQTLLHFNTDKAEETIGFVGKTRNAFIIADTQADDRWVSLDKHIRSALLVPIIYEENLLGIINFPSITPNTFNQEDATNAMTLANNIAIALENARLYASQQQYATRLEETVKERTAELAIALEKAQESDRLKSQFVSDVSHELRTPLNNIKLYLSLLEQGRVEKKTHYMSILNQETNRLQVLIENLLDLSRLDADAIAHNLKSTDLNQLLGIFVVSRMKLVVDKGLVLDFDAGEDIPLVQVDSQLLFQVLTNLLANAINYTPPGGFLTLQSSTYRQQGQYWAIIKMKDDGPGILEEDMAHLFERFYRGTSARGTQGTGLGLAICKEIMSRHDGDITVESMDGKGTTFTLRLPITEPVL